MDPEDGIHYWHYGDTFSFVINKIAYDAIVLDTCGASMSIDYLNKYDNGKNRIDIFISNSKYSFGKTQGFILNEVRFN